MAINQRITIIRTRITDAPQANINNELQILGNSLGLFSLRDKDKSCFRLFIELVKAAKHDSMVSSDELAFRLNLSRGTVIHHMNRLLDSGIVISRNQRYGLRVNNLTELIEQVENDLKSTLQKLKNIANDIDEKLGL